jgi:hypothetical protein
MADSRTFAAVPMHETSFNFIEFYVRQHISMHKAICIIENIAVMLQQRSNCYNVDVLSYLNFQKNQMCTFLFHYRLNRLPVATRLKFDVLCVPTSSSSNGENLALPAYQPLSSANLLFNASERPQLEP